MIEFKEGSTFVSTAEASSSYTHSKSGATNDLSRTFSYDSNFDKCYASTLLFHPEGEGSPSNSVATGSLNLLCGSSGRRDNIVGVVGSSVSVTGSSYSVSSSLPKPGDPGAPPLPEEVLNEIQDTDSGACGSTASGGDANIQPLRSRSISPRSWKNC